MKKRLLKIALSICSLVCFAVAGIGMAFNLGVSDDAEAYEIVLDDAGALQTEYGYGDLLTIPSGTIEGVRASRFVVSSPTGAMYSTPQITLSESGVYTVIWYATVGGKEVAAERTFTVLKSAFDTTGSAKWSYNEQLERVTDREVDGIKVQLTTDSSFTYNRPIDLTDSSQAFIKLYPYQGILNLENAVNKIEDYQFNIEARNIYLTLTDCYDPTNYVTIDLEWAANKDSNRTYWNFRAGAAGQVAHGIRGAWTQGSNYSACDVDGTAMVYMLAPGQGATACNVTDNYGIEFFYDTELNRVYTSHYRYASGAYTKYRDHTIMADLQNADIYPKNPFKGFKGTEVYLTISAGNFILNAANLEIETLGGLSGADILNATMNDTKDPIIEVDESLTGDSLLLAKGEAVEIPDALVYDVSIPFGTLAKKTVYYAYDPNSSNNVVQTLSNGKLTPTKTGSYTIIYSATDGAGNTGTARVDLSCQTVSGNKAVTLNVPATVNASAGTTAQIPECTITGLYTDASKIKKYVKFEDEDEYLFDGDELFLSGVGNYVITYEYDTPFKSYTATSTIVAAPSDAATITVPTLPEYFIKGAEYTLDPAYACEYKAKKPTITTAETYMSSDGGAYVQIDSDAVTITANNTVKFKYVHGTETVYSDIISVVDVGFGGTLQLQKYFVTDSNAVTATATSSNIQYFVDGPTSDVTLKYANVLSYSMFAIDFTLTSTNGAKLPGAFTITLTDFYNRDNKVTLSLKNGGFYINDEQKAAFETSLLDSKTTIASDEGGFKLGGKLYACDTVFTSDRALFQIDFENVTSDACLVIRFLCDRKMSDATTDKAQPFLTVAKTYTGYQPLNRVITVSTANAMDIIAPYVKSGLRLTVRKPNGSYATSLDGVVLNGTCSIDREYELKLDSIGFYSVLYEYSDQNGGSCAYAYSPIVRDETAPVLTVSGVKEGSTVSAVYGATVKVANYTVTDNVSSGEALFTTVCIMAPSGFFTQVTDGKFYAKEKGNYTVIYFCYDEAGNNTTFTYIVKVA